MKIKLLLLLLSLSFYAQAQETPSLFIAEEYLQWYEDEANPCDKGLLHNGAVLKYEGKFINLMQICEFDWKEISTDTYKVNVENFDMYIFHYRHKNIIAFTIRDKNRTFHYSSDMTIGGCRQILSSVLDNMRKKISVKDYASSSRWSDPTNIYSQNPLDISNGFLFRDVITSRLRWFIFLISIDLYNKILILH